jgi:serine/threonine protein phosphatase PrpC
VRAEASTRADERDMATTLSLAVVVWPWLYVVQVGDSRCYLFQDGALRQLTRDQTLAQALVDQGVLTKERAKASPLSHVLASAIGAHEALPEISRVDVRERGCVILVCSDGLTKHVSDAELAEHLAAMTSAEQVCKALLQRALDRGGSDNITLSRDALKRRLRARRLTRRGHDSTQPRTGRVRASSPHARGGHCRQSSVRSGRSGRSASCEPLLDRCAITS